MKSPMHQRPDDEARELTEEFIAEYARKPARPPRRRRAPPPPSSGRASILRAVPGALAIAQVTPFAWEAANEVNHYVARVSDELARRGHRVLIVAPSESSELVRDSRRALRSAPESLLERADGEPLVLGVGEVLPFSPTQRRAASLPVDVARTIEDALSALALDSSTSTSRSRRAPRASPCATRGRSTWAASTRRPSGSSPPSSTRPLSRLLFGRLDARTASYRATRELMQRFFPADYQVILPAADPSSATGGRRRSSS